MNDEVRVFGGPRRYVQGPGALGLVKAWAAALGTEIAVFFDPFLRQLHEDFFAGLDADDHVLLIPVGGEDVTHAHIDALVEAARGRADVVVGIGGGKTLDLSRAVSHALGSAFITVPSIASNDSPAAMAVAVYDEHHHMVEVIQTARNPDAVIVDTALIASAPMEFLVAGIGDAVAKKFEARACGDAGGRSQHGTLPLRTARAVADACYETLRETAVDALAAVRENRVTPALEDTVEAVVLMAGLGFENGGLSIAHSIVRGLQRIPGADKHLHGRHVAYGLMVQRALEGADDAELRDLADFLTSVQLPVSLADLDRPEPTEADYGVLIDQCLGSPHIAKTTARATRESLREAVLRVEALAGRVGK